MTRFASIMVAVALAAGECVHAVHLCSRSTASDTVFGNLHRLQLALPWRLPSISAQTCRWARRSATTETATRRRSSAPTAPSSPTTNTAQVTPSARTTPPRLRPVSSARQSATTETATRRRSSAPTAPSSPTTSTAQATPSAKTSPPRLRPVSSARQSATTETATRRRSSAPTAPSSLTTSTAQATPSAKTSPPRSRPATIECQHGPAIKITSIGTTFSSPLDACELSVQESRERHDTRPLSAMHATVSNLICHSSSSPFVKAQRVFGSTHDRPTLSGDGSIGSRLLMDDIDGASSPQRLDPSFQRLERSAEIE